jgi:5-methyltetrahydropteroyltriglutamate--homocysteine methyltransferase
MTMTTKLLPTSLIGSYPQPDWLIDRGRLAKRLPPRVRASELWRIPEEHLEEAQDDATRCAINDQERAGLDILTDGEIRRESYSNRFATALDGIDLENPVVVLGRSGRKNEVPRVFGKIQRKYPVEVRDVQFLRANTDRMIKVTVPGPYTMSRQAHNDFYDTDAEMTMDYAVAVNEEVKDLLAAGADLVQVDDPYLEAHPDGAREYGLKAMERAIQGVEDRTAVHVCFGYAAMVEGRPSAYEILPELGQTKVQQIAIETGQSGLDCAVLKELNGQKIVLGVIDLSTPEVETPETIAGRIRRALPYIDAKRLTIGPDCGMKYLPRESAFGKLKSLVAGAAIVRKELEG